VIDVVVVWEIEARVGLVEVVWKRRLSGGRRVEEEADCAGLEAE
jgi:hypothetical protein